MFELTEAALPNPTMRKIAQAALNSVHPARCLGSAIPDLTHVERLIVLGAGKASTAMLISLEDHVERHYPALCERMEGLVVTRHGYGRAETRIPIAEAGHPVPDSAGVEATMEILELARSAGSKDHVLVLLSGGGSANWIAPVNGITLADKQKLTKALLACGARITEINCVRRHLSRIKGGRLAAAAYPAPITTLAISDVPGDDPASIASGPTVPDPTTLADARAIIEKYEIELEPALRFALLDEVNESPKPNDACFKKAHLQLIATPDDMVQAASKQAKSMGFEPILLGDAIEGEARSVALSHAQLAKEALEDRRKVAILSGGELTVNVTGHGRGGPNQEYTLALACALEGMHGVTAMAMDTDGSDGGTGEKDDPAGGIIDGTSTQKLAALGLSAEALLQDNDSTGALEACESLIQTGPTGTNANDLRIILVDPDHDPRSNP